VKKLAIVGSSERSRDTAPFDDESFDIWVFNEAANSQWCKRWSACFQMHEPEIYTGHNTKDARHWEWLQESHGKPVYMQEVDSRVPDSVRYPLEEAKALAGVQMFPTTFAYMAALAIMQDYGEIRIFGVDLSASEYQYQANGYLFWFGFLRGRLGAENVDSAVLHLDKNIFEVPLYGYEGSFAFGADYFADRARSLDNKWQAAERNAKNIRKAIDRAAEKKEFERITSLVTEFQGAMITSGEYAGALAEAERYQTFGSRYADRGGFEYAAATAQRDGEEKKPYVWHLGGMIEYSWLAWRQTDKPQALAQMIGLIDRMGETAYSMGAMLGMYKENIEYLLKYDATVNAGGKVLLEAVA
jgi:hypothetical protein